MGDVPKAFENLCRAVEYDFKAKMIPEESSHLEDWQQLQSKLEDSATHLKRAVTKHTALLMISAWCSQTRTETLPRIKDLSELLARYKSKPLSKAIADRNAIRDHLQHLNNLLQALLALTEIEGKEGAEIEILKKKLLTVYAGLQGTNQIALLMAMTQDADCSEDCFVPKVQGALAALAFEFSDDLNKYS